MNETHVAMWLPTRYPTEVEILGLYRSEEAARGACEENYRDTAFGDEVEPLEWSDSITTFTNWAGEMAPIGDDGHYLVTSMSVQGRYA